MIRRTLSARRGGLARFTAAAAVCGIAAGVCGLILALAVGRGFQEELRTRILAASPHVTVLLADRSGIAAPEKAAELIRPISGITGIRPFATASGALKGPDSTTYVVLRSDDAMTAGSAEIGVELAGLTGLGPGDIGELTALASGAVPTVSELPVNGVFKIGIFDFDSTVVKVSPANFAALTGQERFVPTAIEITLADPFAAEVVANQIANSLGQGFRAVSWQEANRPLFAALRLERRAAAVVLLMIVLIAALNITTTLALLVVERKAEIAVLRSCGASARQIIGMFVLEGVLLGVSGAVLGILLGFAASAAANWSGLFVLDPQVYSVAEITITPRITDAFYAATGSLIIAVLASLYPAIRAARLKPMENLRNS